MKTQIGYIKIQGNEIIFVYHEKEFPNALGKDYNSAYDEKLGGFKIFNYKKFNRDWEEYEASKREAEVKNEYTIVIFPIGFLSGDERINLWIEEHIDLGDLFKSDKFCSTIKNNQPCEAEVENGEAMLTANEDFEKWYANESLESR